MLGLAVTALRLVSDTPNLRRLISTYIPRRLLGAGSALLFPVQTLALTVCEWKAYKCNFFTFDTQPATVFRRLLRILEGEFLRLDYDIASMKIFC